MRLILHIGPPKTGTTILQRTLNAARDALSEKSVLYPTPTLEGAYNHRELCGIFVPYENAPRLMRKQTSGQYTRLSRDFCESVKTQIAQIRPKTLILSSEWFARAHDAPGAGQLFAFLNTLGASQIEILLYARRPSSFFLSASQQRLRAASHFAPIFDWKVNAIIEDLQSRFPSNKVSARSFDRQSLIGGSIVSDFAETYIPECKQILASVTGALGDNTSFSAESMVILQNYRRLMWSDQEDIFNMATQRLTGKLKKLDAFDGNPRPHLKPEWEAHLDYGDVRPLLLRDSHGVVFSDFDYERLARGDFCPRPKHDTAVSDIVEVDQNRLWRMMDDLARTYWSTSRRNAKWISEMSHVIDGGLPIKLPLWRKITGV